MTLTTYLVDINSINCSVERSLFEELELEKLANLILQAEGILQPLIVKKIALDEYELIEGNFEYYAAVKAHEIDDYFEMIRVFIIADEQQELIKKQLDLLRQKSTINSQSLDINQNHNNFEVLINNLESRLSNLIYNLQKQQEENKVELDAKINLIQGNIQKKLNPLNAFNTLGIKDLISCLKTTGISQKESLKIAESIEKERKKELFTSLSDIVERVKKPRGKGYIKAISDKKMVEIINNWA